MMRAFAYMTKRSTMIKSLALGLIPAAVAVGATAVLACCLGPWMDLLPGRLAADVRSLLVVVLLVLPSVLTVGAVEYWIWRRGAVRRG